MYRDRAIVKMLVEGSWLLKVPYTREDIKNIHLQKLTDEIAGDFDRDSTE
jgi:hypothetical protein